LKLPLLIPVASINTWVNVSRMVQHVCITISQHVIQYRCTQDVGQNER